MNKICDKKSENLTPSEVKEIDQMIKRELWIKSCEHMHFIREHGREAYEEIIESGEIDC